MILYKIINRLIKLKHTICVINVSTTKIIYSKSIRPQSLYLNMVGFLAPKSWLVFWRSYNQLLIVSLLIYLFCWLAACLSYPTKAVFHLQQCRVLIELSHRTTYAVAQTMFSWNSWGQTSGYSSWLCQPGYRLPTEPARREEVDQGLQATPSAFSAHNQS